jgi:beta-glucosidase
MPLALDHQGGWRNKDVVQAFADYAGLMSERLSDRVRDWITFNEIKHIYEGCYQGGWNAPGLLLSPRVNNQVLHHVHLAHGLAVQSIRARARRKVDVGLVHAFWLRMPADEKKPRDVRAAERCFLDKSSLLFDPLYKGRYPANAWKPGEEPRITDEELRVIATPLDFFGLNCYGGFAVAADDTPAGYREIMPAFDAPRTSMGWVVTPRAMYWSIKHVWDNYPVKRLHVAENGCACVDVLVHDGRVHDEDRIRFLRENIREMHRAMQDGYRVDGYFAWSFFDNFEWTLGYGQRLGLVYVDFPTQRRIPKDSFRFYRDLIRTRKISG